VNRARVPGSEVKFIDFTPEKFERLKTRYAQAVDAHEKTFNFEGADFDTNYAKYVIEYLAMEFAKKGQS
jgi:hypothetical protein